MFSWIHLHDVLATMATAMHDTGMQGVYNTVAPNAVPQAEFAQIAGRVLHRPVWLPLPAWVLRLPMGEMAQLFVDGQRVVPARLQSQGFGFAYPGLTEALQDLT
jgi:NAD dependent epimerase/dehydratase family enzyme